MPADLEKIQHLVSQLSMLIKARQADKARQAAISLCELASKHSDNQQAIEDAGVIELFALMPADPRRIRELVSQLSMPNKARQAAVSLWVLAYKHSDNQQAIADAGAIKPLVELPFGATAGHRPALPDGVSRRKRCWCSAPSERSGWRPWSRPRPRPLTISR